MLQKKRRALWRIVGCFGERLVEKYPQDSNHIFYTQGMAFLEAEVEDGGRIVQTKSEPEVIAENQFLQGERMSHRQALRAMKEGEWNDEEIERMLQDIGSTPEGASFLASPAVFFRCPLCGCRLMVPWEKGDIFAQSKGKT